MNERIKELADKAYCDIKDEFGYWIGRKFDKEKFAQLIVQECMNVVAKKCASPTAYNALAEHWEIEE
jgi:hypothetical protein